MDYETMRKILSDEAKRRLESHPEWIVKRKSYCLDITERDIDATSEAIQRRLAMRRPDIDKCPPGSIRAMLP